MHHPTDRIAHTTAFVIPVMGHWLEREIAQWVHHEGSIRRPIAPWTNAHTMELHLVPSLPKGVKWKWKCYINHLAKTADPQDCPPPPPLPLMNLFNLNHQCLAKINVLPCQLYQSENLHSLGHVRLKETLLLGIIVRMESSHTSQRQTMAGMLNRGRKLQSMCLVKCHGYEVVCIPC